MNYRKILDEQHRLGLSNEKMAQHIGMKSGSIPKTYFIFF